MEGLGSMMAQQQEPQVSVEEVAKMLIQGMTPEQIEAQGVPREVIMQAIQLLRQQQSQSMEREGLAGMVVQNGL